MNLADLREAIRVKTGYPERGATGTNRLNNIINQCLRQLWGEIPEVLLREEMHIRARKEQNYYVHRDSRDRKVLWVDNSKEGYDSFSLYGSGDRVYNGRWIEWKTLGGSRVQRRVASVKHVLVTEEDQSKAWKWKIILREPHPGPVRAGGIDGVASVAGAAWARDDLGQAVTIFEYEYPYDADIQSIRRVIKNPEDNPVELMESVFGDEMDRLKLGSWQETGTITHYSRGSFFQLEAPHYKPSVVKKRPSKPQDLHTPGTPVEWRYWGHEAYAENPDTPREMPNYGPAGSFRYIVCHVWGHWNEKDRALTPGYDNIYTAADFAYTAPPRVDDPSSDLYDKEPVPILYNDPNDASGRMIANSLYLNSVARPWYISAPSKPSDLVSTNWPVWGELGVLSPPENGEAITIETPNVDYLYGFSHDHRAPSYNCSGLEKWIFRARFSTDKSGRSIHGDNHEDDGIYYLWRCVDGHETEIVDRGEYDPVDRRYQLKDFMGHYHIRFNKRPTQEDTFLLSVLRRPPTLNYDTDTPRIPPECYPCIIELACSYLVGDRDGDLKRKSTYYDAHLIELQKLKRMYSFSGHEKPSFSDGLGIRGGSLSVNKKITDIT